jgi:uncharacterized protein (DUF736 family)
MKAGTLKIFTLTVSAAAFFAPPAGAASDEPDSAIVLEGGREGTAFKRMTIEGEDRFRIDFERPLLRFALDPASAPGLDWDNTWEVLAEGALDLRAPLVALSSSQSSPYLPRPWLENYRRGDIIRFRPALTDVERWQLTIADSRNGEVRVFKGKGDPPDMIGWDGLSGDGTPMPPGYTYSYVVEAWDRAGNRRNFVGKGFELPSYRIEKDQGLYFLFPGTALGSRRTSRGSTPKNPSGVLLEAASRMNQLDHPGWKISITVTARTYDQANGMAEAVSLELGSLLLGDPARIQHIADVRADAPETGTVTVSLEPSG